MLRFIVRRLLWAVFLFVVVTFVTYLIFYVTPADPARLVAGQGASPAEVQRVAERLHLNDPIWQQYGYFLQTLVLEQSLGESYKTRQDVNDIIAARAPVTASLVFGGAIFWLTLSIPIGILSALRPRSLLGSGCDDVRVDRDRGAPGLDRPDPAVLHQLQAGLDADRQLLRLLQPRPGLRMRRARAMGVPPDPALDHLHDPVRSLVHPTGARERDGDHERGLRPNRQGQGRPREPRHALAHPAETASCP